MKTIVLCALSMACYSCGHYLSSAKPQSGYVGKIAESDRNSSLQILYSIQYDSTAQKAAREKKLARGPHFERVASWIRSNADSLFNFGYPSSISKECPVNKTQGVVQRRGRKNILRHDDLMPRLLFGQIYTRVDSAWTTEVLPKGDVLLVELRFGKKEYTMEYTHLVAVTLADVHFVRDGVVLYSRLWGSEPYQNINNQQLDRPGAENIRWFSKENFRRLASAIRKDLAKKLMR